MIGWVGKTRIAMHAGFLVAFLVATVTLSWPIVATAADEQAKRDDRPARGIAIYSEFSGVVVPVGESVRMDLTVENKGRQDEVVALKLASVPKGWKASLKGGSFTVTGVAIPDGKTRTLSFSAEPEKGVGPGTYQFGIEGVTADTKLTANYTIAVIDARAQPARRR